MISVLAFPLRGTAYTEAFYAAMEAEGVRVSEGVFTGRWLLKHLRGIDFVHMHWPSFFYNAQRPMACLRGFALFLFLLMLGRVRGARILWTVHNIYPHDPCIIPLLHRLVRWILALTATRFFLHGPTAEAEALRNFPTMTGRTTVIDHGHWITYYPNTSTRSASRGQLGIGDDTFVFLFIGLCKPYKNLEGLIGAFEQASPDAMLLIAGRFDDPSYEARIRAAAERSPASARISLSARFIPDEELQIFLNAADAVVVPYAEILTSGTAMLALSFGCPVVAPALGSLKDVVNEKCGVLYQQHAPEGLQQALRASMEARFDRDCIIAEARKHDWPSSAKRVKEILASICNKSA